MPAVVSFGEGPGSDKETQPIYECVYFWARHSETQEEDCHIFCSAPLSMWMRDYYSVCLNIIRSRTYVRSACFTLQKTAGPLGSHSRRFYSRQCRRHCFLFTRYIFALTRSSFTITVFLSKITFDIFLRDFLLGVKNVACRKEWLKVFSSLKSSPLTTQMETCQLFLPWKTTNILPDSRVWHRTLNCLINSVIQ